MNSATIQYPNNLTAAEYHELAVGSAIHPALIERNFFHIEGEAVYDYLFISDSIPRKNAGRVTDGYLKLYQHLLLGGIWIQSLDPFNNWLPMEWGRIKPTYPRIDLLKGKPIKYESPAKTPNRVTYFDVADCIWDKVQERYNIKRYHSELARRLQDKLNPLKFWEWVQLHPEIPIILCEGEKKAASLISLGFVAIALPGIWNGRVGKKDFNERLHPDLIPLAQPGRKFSILFDYETKLKTRWSVYQATVRTGKAIEASGCVCEVALLPGPEKGVDDFVVEHGENADVLLSAIIDDAKALSDYQRSYHLKKRGLSKYKPNVCVNVKYLSEAFNKKAEGRGQKTEETKISGVAFKDLQLSEKELFPNHFLDSRTSQTHLEKELLPEPSGKLIIPRSGLLVLWSDMGTGKTELMRWWRDQHPDQRFLNNGHRVNLLKNLAERLKTEMYSALGYGGLAKATALSITIDSLYKLNTDALTYGCVFIDEACQYLTHLLHSNTCKEHRAEILEVLEYIVYNATLVVIADAHMDDMTVDFFRAMRPASEVPYIVKNNWRNGGRTIYWYEGDNSSALVAQISAALMSGQKIMVASDSKRFIKKLEQSLTTQGVGEEAWELGSLSMESEEVARGALIRENKGDSCKNELSQEPLLAPLPEQLLHPKPQTPHPTLRIWSVHSGNSGSEENVAFIKDITNAVKNLDALLTSPSLGTGVDICDYHFDLVFGAFHGVSQTATECAQQLYRYRPKVPIHIWVAPKPPFGYLDTNATKIKERLLQTNEMTAFLLRIDRQTGKRGAEKEWALDTYCQIQSIRHQSINNLRADLRDLLAEMGNSFVSMGTDDDALALKCLKDAATALDIAYYSSVALANNISASEYRLRQSKDYLKPEEVFECEKFRIRDAYGMEVTESLVKKDDGGTLVRAISSLEAILSEPDGIIVDADTGKQYPAPPAIVADKDRSERYKLPLCMDWGNYSAKWLARFNLGLRDILNRLVNGSEITAHDPDLLRMTERAQQCAAHIKAILGFTVPSHCSPIWLLAILVEQLGLKLKNRKVGPRGQQVKFYSLSQSELEFALLVIAHRQSKRNLKDERAAKTTKSQQQYQAKMQSEYSVAPINPQVSTPPHHCIGEPPWQGGNTTGQNEEFESIDDDPTFIKACAQMLSEGINHGVGAVKAILQRWTEYLRWGVVLKLEEIAADQLRRLEQLVPQFYQWLSEEILPMECG